MVDVRMIRMIHGDDQWRRAGHDGTSLDAGVVQLAWQREDFSDTHTSAAEAQYGLAFDPWCRLYRSIPEEGRLERWLWSNPDRDQPVIIQLDDADDFRPGQFETVPGPDIRTSDPRAVAITEQGRLFVADASRNEIAVLDLLEDRLLRRVNLRQFGATVRLADLTTDGRRVFALLSGERPQIIVIDARSPPQLLMELEHFSAPTRIARSGTGKFYILDNAGEDSAAVVPSEEPDHRIPVPFACDLAFLGSDVLVVSGLAGQDLRRFRVRRRGHTELPHLTARGYNGRGIAITPDGRVVFWTDRGLRHATRPRVRYTPQGRVTSFRLDSHDFQTIWGRIFVDACIPNDTNIKVVCISSDEEPEGAAVLQRSPPAMDVSVEDLVRPDLSPPMPPVALLDGRAMSQRMHRRDNGRETPWSCRDREDRFETYEAPVIASPGRYLWIILELSGNSHATPKIRSVRVEYPSHDLLRRLPRIYSREQAVADFLRRYLAMLEGMLGDLDQRAAQRHALLDPLSAPHEVLPWLAGFIGLVIDDRWPERAKRELIRQGIWLFRYRGTVVGLKRFLEIYLDCQVTIIEHFKVRGLGGAIVGADDTRTSSAVIGAGFRVGGQIGETDQVTIDEPTLHASFASHAHRFSVVVPISLDQEQLNALRHILDVHRPAHTLYDLCTVDMGLRVGIGLYVELTSLVGRSSGFGELQVGGSALGRGSVLGRPGPGTRLGGSQLGRDSRVA